MPMAPPAARRVGYTALPMRRFAVLLCVLAACSAGPAPVARSADDPSNPNAPESVDAPAAPAAAPDAGHVVYTCPMHPEVTSDHPGHCPKCGMTLVPRP